jgi:glycosyltransferase involved in cell wall biosynthesis
VVTVYDMIPEMLPRTRRRLDLLTIKKQYVMRADHIICISESTRNDLLRTYGDIHCPVSVVHLGVEERFAPDHSRPEGIPEKYILFVGNRGSYKDATSLMRAFGLIHGDFPALHLLFVGGGEFNADEEKLLRELGIRSLTQQVSLSDSDMPGVYGNAILNVFPSRFEGFGLPALEAMACGAPTLLAHSTSLPEVGGDAAAYFPPGDLSALADQMSKILSSSEVQERMRNAGLERARLFTWQKTALETASVYSAALAAPRS